MKKTLPFFMLFLLAGVTTQAQSVLENNPASLKWLQVNTPHFRVLFPKGFDAEGQRVANTLQHLHDAEARSMGSRPRKISIVLQNQSSVSNGFVSMFPRRSEFYTMPPQDYNFAGTNDWLNLLASHEYRHVVQYQHATRGFNRLFYFLFGNPTLAAFAQVAAPSWFWEGDAVATETAFTPSGRGKIPAFGLLFRTNLLEGRTFNYHKQYLRSYKHNIPNHYVLGYHMVSYLRRKTGDPGIWGQISARSWSVPFIPFAFSNAVKNKSGLYVTDLYNEMAATFRQEWQASLDQRQLTPFEKVNPRTTSAYTDYHYPQPLADGSVLVMKHGIGDIEQFVVLKDGKEEKVFTPGFINDAGMLSTAYTSVAWNEYGFDPRWRAKNYSLIKIYDFERKELRTIGGRHQRYGSAAISPQGDRIATVRSDNQYRHALLVLEIFTGKVLQEFPNPQNDFLAMPRWSADGKKIAVLRTTPHGKTIAIADTETETLTDVLPVSHENVGHPQLAGQYLLFNSPASGIDNIHALDMQQGKRYQVTESRYGAYNATVSHDGKTIFYNEQTRDGFDVARIAFEPTAWRSFKTKKEPETFARHLMEQEGHVHTLDSVPTTHLPVTRYRKAGGIFNPYSWGAYADSDLTRATVGLTSRDVLSTTLISAGYVFDLNERTGYWGANVSYQGLYPILDLGVSHGYRSDDEGTVATVIVDDGDTTVVTNDIEFKWTEQNIEGGFRIPLITTHLRFSSGITIGNAVGLTKVTDFRNGLNNERFVPSLIVDDTVRGVYTFFDYIGNGNMVYNRASLSAYHLLKTSRRDIYSRWGQAAYISYFSTPYGGDFDGGLLAVTGYLYFPGLFKHHSINGYWAYQETMVGTSLSLDYNDYVFRNQVPTPRGLSVGRFRKMYSMSVNYTLPVWYPDVAVGPLLNVQRVRLNAFADYARGEYRLYSGADTTYFSVGGEVKFDFNLLRFLPQFNVGFRYAYGIRPAVTKFELLIGTINL